MEAWTLGADGKYRPPRRPRQGSGAQNRLLAELAESVGAG
jgi:hypothetical protein